MVDEKDKSKTIGLFELENIGKPGPFQIIDQEIADSPSGAPKRRYSCSYYQTCLNLAAAFNWDNFTCRGCSSELNQSLLWRAKQELKKDTVVREICSDLPELSCIVQNDEIRFEMPRLRLISK